MRVDTDKLKEDNVRLKLSLEMKIKQKEICFLELNQ